MDALQSPQDDPMYQAFHAAATGAPASSPPPPAPITDTGGEDPMYQAFHAAATRGRPGSAGGKPQAPDDTGGFWAGAKSTMGATAKGVGQFGADYVPGVTQDNALKKWGQEVVDANPVPQGVQGWLEHPIDSALSFGGSMAAGVGTAGGIAALGTGIAALPLPHPLAKGAAMAVGRGLQVAAPYLAFGAPAQSSIREQQIQDDPSAATDLGKKLLATAGAGTVGAITHHMGPAGKLGEPLLTAAGRSALGARLTGSTLTGEFIKGAGMGAAQGLLATPVEQMAALHNPFSPDNLLQTAESAISGALGGGIIGGAMHTGHRALRGSVNDTNTPKDLLNPEPIAGLLGHDGSQGEQWRPTMYGYPEGAVGTAADLPNWTMANALRLDTLRAKAEGTPAREVTDDTGNVTKVPGWKKQKLTKEEAAEYKDLVGREKQGTYQFDPVADEHSFVNQGVPLPVDVGSAIAALHQISRLPSKDGAPIIAGSDEHLAVLRAQSILRAAGFDPGKVAPPVVIGKGHEWQQGDRDTTSAEYAAQATQYATWAARAEAIAAAERQAGRGDSPSALAAQKRAAALRNMEATSQSMATRDNSLVTRIRPPGDLSAHSPLEVSKKSTASKTASGAKAADSATTRPVSPHDEAIKTADLSETKRAAMYTQKGAVRKDVNDFLNARAAETDGDLATWHKAAVESNADKPGSVMGAEWKIPLVEAMLLQRGVKPLTTDAQATKPPAQAAAEPAAQGDQARGMMEHLLIKLQGTQRAGVGRDYAGMLRTYLGLDGTGDEKLQAVAEAHGLSTRSSAHQAIFGYTNRGKRVKGAVERIKDLAEAEGFTSKEAKEALEALRQSREDQYGLSEDQKEIQRTTGGLETGLDSENQGRMDYTDAATHGLISQEMKHHNMGDAAAATGAKYSEDGAESTAKGVPLSSDRMAKASVEALAGDQALDLGAEAKNQPGDVARNTSRTKAVAAFKSAAERKAAVGKTIAEIDAEQAAERAGKEQAKADAQALKAAQQRENTLAAKEKRQPKTLTMGDLNKEVVRGDTSAPKYNHTPEERAKGEMFWAEFAEDAAGVGEQGVAFDAMPKDVQDAYIQAVKDVLNAPTARPNFDRLQKLFHFYSDDYHDTATRSTDTGAGRLPERSVPPSNESPPAAKPTATESGGKAAPNAEAAQAKAGDGRSPEDVPRGVAPEDVRTMWQGVVDTEGLPKFEALTKKDQQKLLTAAKDSREAVDDAIDEIANRLVEEKGAAVEPPVEKAAAPEPDKATAAPADIEPQITRARQLLADLRGKKHDASHVQELLDLLTGSPEVAEAVRVAEGYKNLSAISDAIDAAAKVADHVAAHKPQVDVPQTPTTPTGETQQSAEKVVQRRRTVKVEKTEAPRAAVAEDVAPEAKPGTTDEATLRATLASIAGTDNHRNVTVFATAQEAIAAGALKSENAKGAQAWVHKGRAYFVAENIKKGHELAVFLHEVGVHLGMEKAVGPANYAKLTDQIGSWLAKGEGVEGEIAKAAHARVLAAEGRIEGGIAKGRHKDELLAYFVEEAVKRGIDPTDRKYDSALGRWFSTLWESFKTAVRKLGFDPDKLSAQDMVNLAYGAAKIELDGTPLTRTGLAGKEEGPLFSKAAPDLDAAKTPEQRKEADDFFTRQIDRMPPGPVKEAAGKTYFGIKDAVRNGLLGTAFIHDVVDHLENLGVKSVRNYSDTMEAKNRLSHVLSAPLQDLAGRANDLKAHELAKDGALSVNKFMSDMSYAGKWAWQLPKDSPLWKGRQVQVDPALAKRFSALSPAAQEVAKQAVDFGETMRQELAKVGVDISAGDGPYLPHKRFGNWLVVSKSSEYARREAREDGSHEKLKADPNHYHVSAFESAWEAREFRNQQRANKAYAGEDLDNRVHLTKAEEYFSQIQLAPMQQIARLESMINSENGLSAKQKAAVAASLQSLYKQTLSNVSARHAEQRRANVGGADADMLRALFTQGHASAALVASLAHGKEIEQSLTAMRDEAHNLDRDGNTKSALNEVLRRHALSMLYRPTPIQNKIMALTAFQKVITSPAFFLQQTVEPFMMLAPVLAGHFNDYRGTMKEMGSAYAQAMQTIGLNPMHSGSAPDAILAKLKGHKNSVGRDYDAIKELIETGRADLGNFNEFGNLGMRADKPVAHAVNTVLSKVSRVATDMEEINRIASGLTAYRMKYKQLVAGGKGADAAHTEATAYASRMVDHSHGNYSAWASPRYMMQAGSSLPIRLITQFRKFQVMELSLLGRLVHGAFHADTPESKAMAQRALAYMTGQMAVVAGGLGIPMAGVAADIASLFLRDDNEPWGRETTELHLRKMIGDPTLSNLLLHGAPAGAGVDVSKRIGGGGMGDLAPYSELDVGSRKGFEGTLPKLLGPFIGGTLPAGFDAYKLMRQGEYQRGMESLAPTLIANMSKAQRFAEHGVTNAKGDVLLKPGQLSSFDIAAQALGLPSTHLTDRQFRQSVLMGQEEKWKEMEERYVHQYVKASRDKDTAEKAAALASYKAIQDAKRHAGGIGTPLSEILKAPMEQTRRQVQNVGGVEVTKQTRGIMRQLERQGV